MICIAGLFKTDGEIRSALKVRAATVEFLSPKEDENAPDDYDGVDLDEDLAL